MLPNLSTLKQVRHYLHHELLKFYPEGETASIINLIMEHTGFPSPVYLREPQLIPGTAMIAQINEIVTDIHTNKPIQYILGYTWFCNLKILVNENVLIPRPETEEMIYKILDQHHVMPGEVLDIGTGSGCIAMALKNKFRSTPVTGVDISEKALNMATENARLNELDVRFVQGNILSESAGYIGQDFMLIVSNPPYVREGEKSKMLANVLHFEPELALFVDDIEPLIFYKAIARFCSKHLLRGGTLWVEINEAFGNEVAGIFRDYGMDRIIIHKDIHEKDRFIEATQN